MKKLVLLLSLALPGIASAYTCKGVDSSGGNVVIKAYLERANNAVIQIDIGAVVYNEMAKVNYWSGSNMGHSRCPGSWSGIAIMGTNQESVVKTISITTESQFFGCGFGPADSAEVEIEGQTETIELVCKK